MLHSRTQNKEQWRQSTNQADVAKPSTKEKRKNVLMLKRAKTCTKSWNGQINN